MVGVVGVAVATVRPMVWWVAAAVVASALGALAVAGVAPTTAGPWHGTVTLVTDPESGPGRVQAEAKAADGRRLRLGVTGEQQGELRHRAAGQRLWVEGRVSPRRPDDAYGATRHLVGQLDATEVRFVDDGSAPARAANGVRSVLTTGAEALPRDLRPLYVGLVIGDDRDLDPIVADDFRASGLTHLTAVSGENVAFVLAVAAPLLRRLPRWPRALALAALLGFFALLTRFEPSVLRATVMAGVAALAVLAGRPVVAWRALSAAVAVLIVVDPLLVGALGFQLSVAASAAIIVLARPLAELVRGPRWLIIPLAVTLAAQVVVSPLLAPVAGPLPLSSIVANMLAVPAAGPVMAWGLTAGLVAGVVPASLAAVVQLPIRLPLWWITTVAEKGAARPVAWVSPLAAIVGAVAIVAAVVLLARRGPTPARWVLGLGVAAATVVATLAPIGPARGTTPLVVGADVVVAEDVTVLVVDGRARTASVLSHLRRLGVHRLDAVVVRTDGAAGAQVGVVVTDRLGGRVLRPGTRPGRVGPGVSVRLGSIEVRGVTGADGRPAIEVRPPSV
jgi:competence protein ComEC